MNMEQQFVELCHNNNDDANHVVKGKRTKRQRPLSPCAVVAATAAATSSSSSANSGGHDHDGSFSSRATTFERTLKEEEDMANCLILLAQGKLEENHDGNKKNIITDTIVIATTTTTTTTDINMTTNTTIGATKVGFYGYECKTCNKIFSSFQALGGHMASHKKPKMSIEEKNLTPSLSSFSPRIFKSKEPNQDHIKTTPQIPISIQIGYGNNNRATTFEGNKSKFHECSICGAEFTSGQALGGHMRRHRTSTNSRTNTRTHMVNISGSKTSFDATSTTMEVRSRNVLEFDLNLPAPDEDISDSNFQFMLPPLVGCRN